MSATISPSIKAKPEKLKFLVDRTRPLPQSFSLYVVTACRSEKTGAEPRKVCFAHSSGVFPGPFPVQPPAWRSFYRQGQPAGAGLLGHAGRSDKIQPHARSY
jgi:hypothetical protein